MPSRSPRLSRLLAPLLGMTIAAAAPAAAADLKVLTSGAYKPIVVEMVAPFEKATGHKVEVVNDTAGALVKRVESGEAFDVLVLTPGGLKGLAEKGRVTGDPAVPLAKVGIGVAVKQGAPKPDISTSDAFKQALLDAKTVAMIDPAAGGSSGIYLMRLFERWGIADAIKAKAVLVPGGLVATRVVSGEADLAIHQISEIVAVKDAVLVGALPADIQNYTVYAGGVSATAKQPEAAKAFLKTLAGPDAAKVLEAKGMAPAGS
ncbi:molybdate ABC transporter substrate-binding protein [Rhodoplanes roseus]|uniref:Molybdenum ABC transporter substrate-binding protein n=1 Tax=Rhodoplanes roseus TaxID=29409 RepID=A0A327KLU4_9BRAD|nr:substrate-binding domain-containing protein [Rhodoplanes roseus]RAI39830.1 molybdenum ABC transporter substrate-binding protein [Rhodoplanes roseus]